MIDILKQHARERRITLALFIAAALILVTIQWGIANFSADSGSTTSVHEDSQ